MKTTLTTKLAAAAATTGMAVAAFLGVAGPAHAEVSGGTTATFTITAGSLSVTVPTGPVALATVAAGAATASGPLGNVAVNDTRGLLLSSWTTTVTSTAFSTGAGTAPHRTVPAASVVYASGTATSSGSGIFVPGVLAWAPPGPGPVATTPPPGTPR